MIAARLKKDGIKGIEHMKIEVGIPIRPAAAERLPSAKAIVDKLGDCVAQPKLDGFRLQVHVKKKKSGKREIHFFSRNLQDMSSMFPDLEKAFEKLPIDSLICEGEAIVFDPSTGSFLPFQETVKRKRKHGIEAAMEQLPLQFFIFDLLYLNGESLLSDTHEQRRKMLQDLFKNFKNNVIKVVEEKKIETAKELYSDVWVSPEIVCLIRADEITLSPIHAAGKTEKILAMRYALHVL